MESLSRFVRSFWQPIVVSLLALVLVGQLASWGYTSLQMHSIDRLVAAAQNEEEKNTENPYNNPGRSRRSSTLQPKADIFLRRKPSYNLAAIYKDQAVINGQTVKAGERIGKATLERILLSSVMIHEDGKSPQEIKMFQGSGDTGGGPMMRGRRGRGGRPGAPFVQDVSSQMSAGAPSGGGPRLSREGISSDRRTQMREMFTRFRDGSLNIEELPPEMQEMASRMRERMGSGGMGGGRGDRRGGRSPG